ncbi:MAG TPA: sigma 54-interacting transcriptional regulator [Pyrinomonadaceae bacterium]|jgi:transcriptional regulator with GAF, ATPase, and Fis domain
MKPRLVNTSGREESETIFLDLEERDFSIGRIGDNHLRLHSASVSRRHCSIALRGGEITIKDLGSHNGTFVNDRRIDESVLKHGDRIGIGASRFVFLIDEEADEKFFAQDARFDDGGLITKSDIRLFPGSDFAHGAPHLDSLVRLGKALNETESADTLQSRILEILLETIPARRGAILLFEPGGNDPQSVRVASKTAGGNENMTISRTVCERVRREKIALLSNDLAVNGLEHSESLMAHKVTSLLAAPLQIGEIDGLIYLDTNNFQTVFDEVHLHQTTAISFLVSAALEQKFLIKNLQSENRRLQETLQLESDIVGESRAVGEVFRLIAKVAPSDAGVLITGESGTGKELAAQAIHRNSTRRGKPFVAVNCAVLNENLIESELFGHEKGSFTGATLQKIGKFEHAEGGTIFLDEIGELTPKIQAKLLRVLQEREFERVGGTRTIKTNVRVIAATNRNLSEEVKNGTFREDLFFRLNVVQIKMPPLRERKSDVPVLAKYFLEKYSRTCNRRVTGFSPETQEILLNYEWRGNIRELENAVERAVVIGSTEQILPEDLPEEIVEFAGAQTDLSPDYHQQIKLAKQKIILSAIEKAEGNYTEAARSLGIHPNNLHRIIRDLGVRGELNKIV